MNVPVLRPEFSLSNCTETQENSFKTSPFKKISRLRSQSKKAPKFSDLINITCWSFNTSPHKELSRLKSNRFDETIILPI
jgi:hypothetical protein